MLIIGAKGFAKEVVEILHQNKDTENLSFYDDVTPTIGDQLFNRFPIIKTLDEAKNYFDTIDQRFTLGIGNPKLRWSLYQKFSDIGGIFTSTISTKAELPFFSVHIGEGCNILSGVQISNDVVLGKGCIVYYNSIITHDVQVGDFVEISPSVTLLGRCTIGTKTQLGSNSTILPDIKIGKNVIVAAGSVVTKDVPDDVMVAGIPAQIKKHLPIS